MKLYEEPQKIIKAFFCDATAVYKDNALHHTVLIQEIYF